MAQAPLTLDERMVRVETPLDRIDQHLTRIDGRFDGLERRIDRRMLANHLAILPSSLPSG